MKRSDLHVGDVLYYAETRHWNRDQEGYSGNRVVVVSPEPHLNIRGHAVADKRGGNTALVEFVRETGTRDGDTMPTTRRASIVQLAHLRGPYEQTAAEVAARKEAADTARRAESADRRAVSEWTAVIVTRASAAGADSTRGTTHWIAHRREDAMVSMSVLDLKRLLDRLGQLEAAHAHGTGAVYDIPPGTLG